MQSWIKGIKGHSDVPAEIHVCIPNIGKVEAGGLSFQGLLGLPSKDEANLKW